MAKLQKATFACGCFWCAEAIFKRLKGVESVVSGYAGGLMEDPSYEQVSSGKTGHAEAIELTFDPDVISYDLLLDVFWHLHDPTTPNRQGADVGPQYRSIIFYRDETQKRAAIASKAKVEKEGIFQLPIVTEIVALKSFYRAEDSHQNFYENNRSSAYCQIVIDPKIQKLLREYKNEVKEGL